MSADPRNQVVSTFHLRRRTPGSFLLVPCPRQGRSIRCQGQLEGAAAAILVACPMVAHIQEQPLTIWYQWREQGNTLHIELLQAAPDVRPRKEANAGCSYIVPDFLVEMASGQKRLVEVKPSDRLAKPLAQRKLSVARQYAATEGTSPCSLPAWNGVHNQKRLPFIRSRRHLAACLRGAVFPITWLSSCTRQPCR